MFCKDCLHYEVCLRHNATVSFEVSDGVCLYFLTLDDIVPHGRWEKQQGLYSCSRCGKTCPYDVQADVIVYWRCNYCPNCGAKMDLEE